MYDNDRRTGTDYEYNHGLDEYMQQRYQKPKNVYVKPKEENKESEKHND